MEPIFGNGNTEEDLERMMAILAAAKEVLTKIQEVI
jgi:hypothetical protein